MAFTVCERCGLWHRADFSCDTARRLTVTNYAGQCSLCGTPHPTVITCAMAPDWLRWKDGSEAKARAAWDDTLAEAWRDAQAIARLNNAITLLDRTDSRTRSDTKDLPVSASDE